VPYPTEQAVITVKILNWIREVLDSNLVRDTSYPQSIQENAWIETQITTASFQILSNLSFIFLNGKAFRL
jgi:hypothetical protein